VASAALPQDYPSRPIRIIVPFPAGGTPAQFAEFMRTELVKWAGSSGSPARAWNDDCPICRL
jgi:tripartite-type tricarboxylate transporter receptor subunit TctC